MDGNSAYDEIIPDAQGYPGYDKNGNIMGLKRYSSTGSISDYFTYNYYQNKNRLTSVSGTSAIQYKYDGNCNVTADPRWWMSHRCLRSIRNDISVENKSSTIDLRSIGATYILRKWRETEICRSIRSENFFCYLLSTDRSLL